MIPNVVKGSTSEIFKWATAKIKLLSKIAPQTGKYRVKEGKRNPLNKISSNTGAATEAVIKKINNAQLSWFSKAMGKMGFLPPFSY